MVDKKAFKINGFVALLFELIIIYGVLSSWGNENTFAAVIFGVLAVIGFSGFAMIHPNETKVITFFGKYAGTIKENGFWYTIPFSQSTNVTLRVRNFNSDKLKVNDVDGNPIEIAAVVVFKVVDSAKATFDVQNYIHFVEIQSEAGIREIASRYPYDTHEEGLSLRGDGDQIAQELTLILHERLKVAGVEVLEANIMHLAYAPEIAQAMLQRQQASAIVGARQKIVEGATAMVKDVVADLYKDGSIHFSEEEKARLATNLMVAIVSDKGVQPTVDASSR